MPRTRELNRFKDIQNGVELGKCSRIWILRVELFNQTLRTILGQLRLPGSAMPRANSGTGHRFVSEGHQVDGA